MADFWKPNRINCLTKKTPTIDCEKLKTNLQVKYNSKGELRMGDVCAKVQAFILINAKPGELWKVVEEAKKIANVKIAEPVSGRFDVVVYAETDNLAWIVSRIHSIKGIVRSETLVVLGPQFE